MNITIITSENRRLYPAIVYDSSDTEYNNPVLDINDIYDLLYKDQNILVISDQYDQYGNKLKMFEGHLEKSDIKTILGVKEDDKVNDLSSVMTLSEAAKKWGLSNGSTIRKAIERGKFKSGEIKQAGSVWIITYSAMERVFGSIKNEEDAYVLYDNFYFTKDFWNFAKSAYYKGFTTIDSRAKDLELKFEYAEKVLGEGLKYLRNNKKVIVRTEINQEIKQIISCEDEFFSYIERYYSRRDLNEELLEKLIKKLKS